MFLFQLLLFLPAGLQDLSAGSHGNCWHCRILGKYAFKRQTRLFLFLLYLLILRLICVINQRESVKQQFLYFQHFYDTMWSLIFLF